MMSIKTPYSICSLALLLTACSNPQPKKPIIPYQPIPISSQTATLAGAQIPVKIYDDITAYVFAIGQQKVLAGRQGWNTPLALTAGQHAIQIWCQQGGYKYTNIVQLDTQAGARYQVDFNYNYDDQPNCRFWIKNLQSNKPVTDLIEGVEIWQYTDPKTVPPLEKPLAPRVDINTPSYTVPIRVINKMGSR